MEKERLLKRLAYHEGMIDDKYVKAVLHDAYEYISQENGKTRAVWKDDTSIQHWMCDQCEEPLMIGFKFCPMCGRAVIWQ